MNVIITEMLPGIPDPDTRIKTVFLSSVRLTHWFTKLCSRLSIFAFAAIAGRGLLCATPLVTQQQQIFFLVSSCFCSLDRTETLPISTHVTVSQTSVPESQTGRTGMHAAALGGVEKYHRPCNLGGSPQREHIPQKHFVPVK